MSRWPNKYVIGLTGNIAVGKSVVRQMLQHLGAYTIDADGLARQAMSPGAPAYKPVVEEFGKLILNADGTINRAMLGKIVFTNPAALEQLEAITHPIIRQAINTLVSRSKQPVVVIEAIKLLDGDLKEAVDAVWVVDAKPQAQYTRLVGKRKMSEEDAKQRILAQSPQAEKLKAATVVIKNDGNIEETWKQVQVAWGKIPKPGQAPAATAKPAAPSTPAAQKPAAPAQPAEPVPDDDESTVETVPVDTSGITVKRGMPTNAEAIAEFINKHTGQSLTRMDVMMSFGEKSYILATGSSDAISGLMGFQVENLITRVDEFYLDAKAGSAAAIYALIKAIEEASTALQSEVGFFFLPGSAGNDVVEPFVKSGYERTGVKDIKIPAWREAVQEHMNDDTILLSKKLRKDRVLKPI